MLEKLIHYCVNRRVATIVVTLGIALYGIFAFTRTPIEAFPDVTNLQVNIITTAPGLAPEEVERQVTVPLERALNGVPRMTQMRSESLFGLSLIWIVFDDNADSFVARTRVQERLMTAELPDGIHPELAPDYTPLGKVYYYQLTSDRHDLTELRTWQELTVARVLRQVPGVADVIGFGGYLKEFHVEVDPSRLAALGLDLLEVVETLERSNRNVGGGFLRAGEQEIVIRSIGMMQDADDIRSVVLRAEGGTSITVGDVANVIQSHTPRRGSVGIDDQDDIVQGIILLRRGENPNVVLDAARQRVEEINDGVLPDGMRIELIYDRGDMVSRTLSTVYTNLWHALLLVLAVVWIGLRSMRGSLIVVTVIPLSMLVAFIGLYHLGLPANLISMGAIDFGIFVDGAVVLVENVIRAQREERPRTRRHMLRLVVRSAVDVARPTFYAMAIIIAALIPVFTLESVEGRIFRPLALTYSFALLGALVFAFTIIPALCAVAMKPSVAVGEDPAFFLKLRDGYRAALAKVLSLRAAVLVTGIVALGLTGLLGRQLGTEFLPALDEGDIYIFTELPPSVSLDEGRRWMGEIRHVLRQYPEVISVVTEQGRPEDGTDNEGVNMAKVFVRLLPQEQWATGRSKEELIDAMRADLHQFPGVRFNFSQPIRDSVEEAVSGVRGQVVLKIFGPDLEVMRATLLDAMDALVAIDGIVDLDLYRDSTVPQLQIHLDREALARNGILVEDAQTLVETALAGSLVTDIWEQENRVPVRVRLPATERTDIAAINNIMVPTVYDTWVPLQEIADVGSASGRTFIPRENNSRYLALKFNVEGRDIGSVIRDAMRAVDDAVTVPGDHYLVWGGEFENQQRAMKRLSVIVPLSLLIVLALLYGAMRSGRGAVCVLLLAPFGMTGGVLALLVSGVELSVSAAIGFIALLGQISLLGLLLLSAIEDERRAGRDLKTAIIEGSAARFRALLLTAPTTALGLLPMAASTGMGSETQRPFALVLVGGLLTTLVFTLFLLPVLYTYIAAPELPGDDGLNDLDEEVVPA